MNILNICERIERLRERRHLSKAELCYILGIGRTMLHYVELGKRNLKPAKLRLLMDLEVESGIVRETSKSRSFNECKTGEHLVNISERLNRLRELRNLSKAELCDALGIGRTTLHYVETGHSKLKPDKMRRLHELERQSGIIEQSEVPIGVKGMLEDDGTAKELLNIIRVAEELLDKAKRLLVRIGSKSSGQEES